jgi:5-methylcytosine-specific restriction endonuclease McrA
MSRTPPRWGKGQQIKHGWAWQALRRQVLARDGHTCQACLSYDPTGETLQADHIVSREAGGPDTLENLRTLCLPCHRARTRAERSSRTYRPPAPRPNGGAVTWEQIEREEQEVENIKRQRGRRP